MTRSDFIEQTTANMIKILEDKVDFNQLVIDQFKEKGKDTSGIDNTNKDFKTVISTLKTWDGCLS